MSKALSEVEIVVDLYGIMPGLIFRLMITVLIRETLIGRAGNGLGKDVLAQICLVELPMNRMGIP